jgi:hypothetical protein
MSCDHERLDVYRAALEYVGWAYDFCTQRQESIPIPIPIPTPRGEAEPRNCRTNPLHQTGATGTIGKQGAQVWRRLVSVKR